MSGPEQLPNAATGGAIHADLSRPAISPRTTSRLFGGPIHAAAGNRQ
ncbi:MAG: hypothetical protein INF75_17530 [Roseomonas sp.]|nr:hypothetical protein [Roseomonas sp.]MCA3328741.1 hypothetical protein [Roseomonas sp.]MCA3333067.1 hypothetical protein [Roseomonas sp.]MCA3335860.1 hypothetical protein [Roseomonas sp.]MCA3345744.1 hypothetical protein [Roseomonas sp.]